jgi:hypothetical protein
VAGEWASPKGEWESTIIYDLGDIYSIDQIALWNGEHNSIMAVKIHFDAGADDADKLSWSPAYPSDVVDNSAYAADLYTFAPVLTDRVYLDIVGDPGKPYISMGEIAFSATDPTPTPVPPAAFLLFSGIIGLVSIRRFRQ